MAETQLKEAIVLIYPYKLYFFGSNITDRILSLNFPPNVIKDLEVINPDQIYILIKAFCEFYKISPCRLIMIASEAVCFDKIIQKIEDENSFEFLQNFLDNVPFEKTVSGVFKVNKETKIIALNKDLFSAFKKAFELQKYTVDSIVPEFVVKNLTEIKTGLDVKKTAVLIDKSYTYKAFKFHLEDKSFYYQRSSTSGQNLEKKNDNSSLKILLPVLAVLIILLVFIYSKTAAQNLATPKNINQQNVNYDPTGINPLPSPTILPPSPSLIPVSSTPTDLNESGPELIPST